MENQEGTINEITSKQVLETLHSKYEDFWTDYYIDNIQTWSRWKMFSEVKELPLEKKMYRSILSSEIVLDIESKEYEDIKEELLKRDLKFKIFDSGGKGIHIHIFFSELKNLHESLRPYIKEHIIKKLSFDRADLKKKDNKNLIGVEFSQHRKGNQKKLLFETDPKWYPENKFWDELKIYIESLPESFEGTIVENISPKIVFKNKKRCDAVDRLIKKGEKAGRRNYGAMLIVQQLRDYCGYDFNDCWEAIKEYNKSCSPIKEEDKLKRDLVEQYKRKYDINCKTLKECKYCIYQDLKKCSLHKDFSGLSKDVGEEIPLQLTSTERFTKALDEYYFDWDTLAEKFYSINPIYYDSSRNYWMWDAKNYKYVRVDETDLLNAIMGYLNKKNSSDTYNTEIKNKILDSIRRIGRRHIPKVPNTTWIQFKDEIVDFTNKEFSMKASPNYFFTNPIPWQLGKSIETPIMDKMFMEWVGEKYKPTLYEILAFAVCTQMHIHRIFCLKGVGRNGKGQFLKVLRKYVGEDNCSTADIDFINSRFECSALYKKLIVIIGEIDKGVFKKTRALKAYAGDDLVRGEFKGKDKFDFVNYAKPIIATNSIPQTDDHSDGFYARWTIVDFPNQFPEGKDIFLKIPSEEYENFAKKSINLLYELIERGNFTNDGDISQRKSRYEEASNPINEFFEDCCELDDPNASIKLSILYEKYRNWLREKKLRDSSLKEFSKLLRLKKYEIKKIVLQENGKNVSTENKVFGVRLYENPDETRFLGDL